MRSGFIEFARYTRPRRASSFTTAMQPSKSVSSAKTRRPVRERLHELRGRDPPARQEHRHRQPRRRAVRRERRATCRPCSRSNHARLDRPLRDRLAHDAHEHRHPEVLERPGVRVPALLDPQVGHPDLAPEPLGPEEVRPPLAGRDDARRRARRARPTRACPTRPSRTATACACSGRRRASSTPRRSDRGAPPCRARPRAARRTSGSGRWRRQRVLARAPGEAVEDGAVARHQGFGFTTQRRLVPVAVGVGRQT